MKNVSIMWLSIVGFVLLFMGVVMTFTLPDVFLPVAAILIIVGIGLDIFPYLRSTRMYKCPECKTLFPMPQKEITLIAGRGAIVALLTCPKCKKTRICMRQMVLKTSDK